ncbi:uncharacterized protein M6B38_387260 [Iris pallida]|uniref:Uncharacterized protein n=1 Tax=Iris pallida TaxID=29817 RepID=A0AAX6G2R7_IRIPA|nr:uncharacterized protein M6B38_387260 [Iris pallida]
MLLNSYFQIEINEEGAAATPILSKIISRKEKGDELAYLGEITGLTLAVEMCGSDDAWGQETVPVRQC